MRVWIVQPGEPLPTDPGGPRLWRSGLLAATLRARGHDVVWWASAFRHADHAFRAPHDVTETWNGITIVQVHSPGYRRNVSLARLRDHHVLGRRMAAAAARFPRPDVVHCGYPPLETAEAMVAYGEAHRVPVVIDVRDMWPEAFGDVIPKWARVPARPAFAYLNRRVARMLARATAIHGHTPGFRDYGLAKAGRRAGAFDRWFPFGYPDAPGDQDAIAAAGAFWDGLGVRRDAAWLTLCFFGNLNTERRDIDHDTPAQALRILKQRGVSVRAVYCGTGRVADRLKRTFGDLDAHLIMPGYVDAARIWALMQRSDLGLLPYLPAGDFARSLPNKSIEYLAGGVPVLTSLVPSYLYDRLAEDDCVVGYEAAAPARLADALGRLATDRDRLDRLGRQARATFERDYRASTVYGALADTLEELAAAGQRTADARLVT